MKKQLISCFGGGLISILCVNNSFAQEEPIKELPPITVSASTSNVTARVNRAFGQIFKDASHQHWYQLDKNFMVKFIKNDQENSALFTKNGHLVYHISYGFEKNLPPEVRNQVKSKYYDLNITRVFKINEDNRNIWVVSLEDARDYIMARIENMELEETLRMKKSK